MNELASVIRTRYVHIQERIATAAQHSGRNAEDVKLVVVSKAQPVEVISAAIEAGICTFGENYVEEAVEKIHHFDTAGQLNWHMIGHLQSRKAGQVADAFDYLHSLDSLHLAQRLNNALLVNHKTLPVLLEVNVSGEESKFGWPAWDESQWMALVPELERLGLYPQLVPCGLMSMPPLTPDSEMARPFFTKLSRLRDFLADKLPGFCWEELSMGTSADFEIAVEEGATFVRIGQAILGARPARNLNVIQRRV